MCPDLLVEDLLWRDELSDVWESERVRTEEWRKWDVMDEVTSGQVMGNGDLITEASAKIKTTDPFTLVEQTTRSNVNRPESLI